MHARLSRRQVRPNQMDDAMGILRDQTVPFVREQAGFKGGLILADRSGGKLVTITLWETEADLTANVPLGFLDVVTMGRATWEIYEVADQEFRGVFG